MKDEIIRILDMVKSGKITVEEGEKLIEAISESDKGYESIEVIEVKKKKPSMLRIRINVDGTRKEEAVKVNVNIPLKLAKKVARLTSMMPKEASEQLQGQGINLNDIDIVELIEAFEQGEMDEELVNIETGSDSEKVVVKVYVD